MLPICYEEALPNGAADQCAEFVATATEMFIKDVIGSVISLTRNNFLSNVKNGHNNGTVAKHQTNYNSSVVGMPGSRPISISDVRLALGVLACSLGQMPDIVSNIMSGYPDGVLEGLDTYDQELDLGIPVHDRVIHDLDSAFGTSKPHNNTVLTNGIHGPTTNGIIMDDVVMTNGDTLTNGELLHGDEPAADGWAGSSTKDRNSLFDTLDECLAFGQ